jgi:hypothetical protein
MDMPLPAFFGYMENLSRPVNDGTRLDEILIRMRPFIAIHPSLIYSQNKDDYAAMALPVFLAAMPLDKYAHRLKNVWLEAMTKYQQFLETVPHSDVLLPVATDHDTVVREYLSEYHYDPVIGIEDFNAALDKRLELMNPTERSLIQRYRSTQAFVRFREYFAPSIHERLSTQYQQLNQTTQTDYLHGWGEEVTAGLAADQLVNEIIQARS